MAFGKKGRPPEDRLARQREIYSAVSPLIVEIGARQLSMRQAAGAACLSLGGLYHYFPTKRDLVLHGLRPEAISMRCQEFHNQFGYLAESDTHRYIEEGIRVIVDHVGFCRPAIHAALELGTESFWEVIETLLTSTTLDFEVNLRRVAPGASDHEIHQWTRTICRSICAALLDKRITTDELSDELRMLVDGYTNRIGRGGRSQAYPLIDTATAVLVHEH